jgi:hypothetical protein
MPESRMSQAEQFERVRRLLPPLVNLELLVLKGHLLMEEQLELILEAHSRVPKLIKDARLSFIQKLHLAQAVSGIETDQEWRFIVRVNTLRNSLVHRLEPGDVAALVDDVLRSYWLKEFRTPTSTRQRASRLRQILILVIAMLSGFARGCEAARESAGKP